ncbi:hypothetical protein SAMN04487866_10148 [Thermoactinomyces sp. DSM 45891]|uniref:PHP domain-containing protein n=1 Tax=Thermoactinomyces sp. DSM 45891 TaxID=1761907 RepID=UPI000912FE40|nr:PHP domain-containing protein [Thermoactinomyces sp. DSM 45891]SFW98290.1 hypothetical protein SAMN04487866_10148 [Thermoactinomyces sp. DSM 45891]
MDNIYLDLPLHSFDLHIHTTASDGVFTPSEIVQQAKEKGLKTISITDHDTVYGVQEAISAGMQEGIHVIPGVEISTRFQKKNIDILGYGMEDLDLLEELLRPFREARTHRAERIVTKLCQLGMDLTLDDVKEFSGDHLIARPHIAHAIVKKGYVPDLQFAFDHYLGDGKPAAEDKLEISVEDGIKMIHQTGGKAVLAHPVYLPDRSWVPLLLQNPFDGIEAWHRSHSWKDSEYYLRLAQEHRLFVTGGSDYHNPSHKLGDFIKNPT